MARVGTWNLADLFTVADEGGPGSQDEYEAKVSALARTIDGLGVDVLAVQEVGSPAALDDVVSRLEGRWLRSLADPDHRGIRVGFLSRQGLRDPQQFPFHAPKLPAVAIDDEGTTTAELSRPGLRVTVELDGTAVELVVCHFASKRPHFPGGTVEPDDEDQRARFAAYATWHRAAEAATVRILADQLLRGDGQHRPLVVLGDLNDTEYSATTSILEGPRGDDAEGDGWRLWNAGISIAPERRHSRTHGDRRELVDHIFVSHALLAGLGDVTTHDATDPAASDHRPVTADLDPSTVPAPASESAGVAGSTESAGRSGSASADGDGSGDSEPATEMAGRTETSDDDGGTAAAATDDDDASTDDSTASDETSGDDTTSGDDSTASDEARATSGDDGAASDEDRAASDEAGETSGETDKSDVPAGGGEPPTRADGSGGRSGLVERAKSFFGRSRS